MVIIAAAIMLQGHLSREKIGQRVLFSALAGILIQTLAILTRGLTVSSPAAWPLMYLAILVPIGLGIFMLWRPFWLTELRYTMTSTAQNRQKPERSG